MGEAGLDLGVGEGLCLFTEGQWSRSVIRIVFLLYLS
jgi:hypothetical protein